MMKKVLVLAFITGSLTATAFAEEAAKVDPLDVSGGTITFNGEITNGACAISSEDSNQTVTLDTVPSSTFTAADQLGNAVKPFTIKLVNCDTSTYKTVAVTFSGTSDATTPTLLANQAGVGGAKNVGLQLFDSKSQPLALNTATSAFDLSTADTTLNFSVDYKSTAATVTAGKVQSVADFKLTYN